jgi:hypothetical protein
MGFKLRDLLRDVPELLERRDRCATGKTTFYSKRDACRALEQINRRERTHMSAFRCGACAWWHIGHRRGQVI